MEKQCEICQKEFTLNKYWQKYCSPKCKILAWAKKELEKINKKKIDKSAKVCL